MSAHSWTFIEPLSDQERNIDLADIAPLYESWRATKSRLNGSSAGQLAEFNKRLVRRLSVETGILERVYDLDRGTTEALVAKGFAEELISSSSTNVEPSKLIDILRDQEAAINLVLECVSSRRELTKGILHELHTILMRHQETTNAVDQFGSRMEIPLLKGKFKTQPNNPKRPDGSVHEYCPPVHVESEVEKLLEWLASYSSEDPIIVAAWFHHRFTQIHPYQDGNGRLARALTTLILLRAELLPLVVDRDLRSKYIEALEEADRGGLSMLAEMFAQLERQTILEALSVDIDAEISHHSSVTAAVIENLTDRFSKRKSRKLAELRSVNDVAIELRSKTHKALAKFIDTFEPTLKQIGEVKRSATDGGPDRSNGHWYRFEVLKSATDAKTFANLSENHYFVKESIQVNRERLVFIVSFHHVGRELTGVMEATAFMQLLSYDDSDEGDSPSRRFSQCCVAPFVFTYKTKPSEVASSFEHWLDAAFAVALQEFGNQL